MGRILEEDLHRTAAFLVSEGQGTISREQEMIAGGSGKIKPGTVLGKVTASGKLKPLAPAANDGTQNAAAILYEGCDTGKDDGAEDVRRTIIARHAEVHGAMLLWPDGIADAKKKAAVEKLAGLGIVIR